MMRNEGSYKHNKTQCIYIYIIYIYIIYIYIIYIYIIYIYIIYIFNNMPKRLIQSQPVPGTLTNFSSYVVV